MIKLILKKMPYNWFKVLLKWANSYEREIQRQKRLNKKKQQQPKQSVQDLNKLKYKPSWFFDYDDLI